MSEAPIAASPLDVGVMPLAEQVASLRRGNTALIEALMDMVNQFFYHKGENGEPDEDGPILRHSFMSAEEGAISVLMQAGFAEEAPDKGYRLLWDKLEQRRKDVGLAQQTWEEAAWNAAAVAEREVCAMICDKQGREWDSDDVVTEKNYAAHCAAAICDQHGQTLGAICGNELRRMTKGET